MVQWDGTDSRYRHAYALGRYDECELHCKQTSTEATSATRIAEVQILKAKSIYHIYTLQQRQFWMQQTFSTSSDFFKWHRDCYHSAKEVVKSFGHLRDGVGGAVDPGCQRMLDFAMLDYCLETNRLKQLKQCFLCLWHSPTWNWNHFKYCLPWCCLVGWREVSTLGVIPHSKDSSYFEQAMEAKMDEVKMKLPSETMQPKCLQASHLVPHAIIKRLAKVVLQIPSWKMLFSVSVGPKIAWLLHWCGHQPDAPLLCCADIVSTNWTCLMKKLFYPFLTNSMIQFFLVLFFYLAMERNFNISALVSSSGPCVLL